MKKATTYKVLDFLLIFGILITLGTLFFVPSIISDFIKNYEPINNIINSNSNIVMGVSIGVYICAIPYIVSLFLLKRLSTLLSLSNPFIKDVAKIFKNISICAFLEFVLVNVISIFIAFTYIFDKDIFFSLIIIIGLLSMLLLVIGFISLIASNLFNKAIELKYENDHTI